MSTELRQQLPDYVTVSRRRVKWARIQVQASGEVLMVVPPAVTAEQILQFYQHKLGWIAKQRARAQSRSEPLLTLAADQVMLFGNAYRMLEDARYRRCARLDHAVRCIYYAGQLATRDQQQRWLRAYARVYLNERLAQLAELHGFRYNRVFIREQKTRWGSCSSRRNISLNWKLVKAPVAVSDYVLVHELVHTEIMNHSAAFWQRVEALLPDFISAKDWLRRHGASL